MSKHFKTQLVSLLLVLPFLFSVFNPVYSASDSSNPNSTSQNFLIRPWAVGQSISLQTKSFRDGDLSNVQTITYSIVGFEAVKGINYFWMEIERSPTAGVTTIKKIQVRQPGAIDFENVLSGDLLSGNYGVLTARRRIQKTILVESNRSSVANEYEVSPDTASQIENGSAPSETKDYTGLYLASPDESLNVPAGTFKVIKFHRNLPSLAIPNSNGKPKFSKSVKDNSQFIDAWGTAEIPIWGLAKETEQFIGSNREKITLQTELLSFNETGATPKIKSASRIVPLESQKKLSKDISGAPSKNLLGSELP